jgi:hypothetical protein
MDEEIDVGFSASLHRGWWCGGACWHVQAPPDDSEEEGLKALSQLEAKLGDKEP